VYVNVFFFPIGLGPIVGFLPTIARQLGYSMTTYGATMTFMSVISMVLVPLSGVIVDRFRIKKRLFLVSMFGIGVVSLLFLFVPKAPLDVAKIELKCDAQITTMTVVNENNNLQTMSHVTNFTAANHTSGDELITCKVRTILQYNYVTINIKNFILFKLDLALKTRVGIIGIVRLYYIGLI